MDIQKKLLTEQSGRKAEQETIRCMFEALTKARMYLSGGDSSLSMSMDELIEKHKKLSKNG
ncbi:MAG TPA: hypothetical protein VIY47_00295 [Ignavibacteriaceae bacterium]